MNLFRYSLRLRLLVLILVPMLLISFAATAWRYSEAKKTAETIFDRNLTMMSFAVARDVALSEGDSLSQTTRALFKEVSGTDVFYHVYGPDGSFITGYSSPPTSKTEQTPLTGQSPPQLFNAAHLGQSVRVARLSEPSNIQGLSGFSTITVWQTLDQRDAFARTAAMRAGAFALMLLLTVAAVVFFGISLGLRPLLELEDAIQRRSADDLSPIARKVPEETRGIVKRLNALFNQVTLTQESKNRFISDAAHQLRNPVAALHAMAQATQNSKTLKQSQTRSKALVTETRRAVRLTNQLLSFERLRGKSEALVKVDLNALVEKAAQKFAPEALAKGLDFSVEIPETKTFILGNETWLTEAILNMLDNAIRHGGDRMTFIKICIKNDTQATKLVVTNDGNPFQNGANKNLFDRFVQGDESEGSGLGLAIVHEIVSMHDAQVAISNDSQEAEITVAFKRLENSYFNHQQNMGKLNSIPCYSSTFLIKELPLLFYKAELA